MAEKNLLHMRPKHNREWQELGDGKIELFVPKFSNKNPIGRWLLSRMKKPNYRVKLDDFGSLVWTKCDGNTSVEEIGNSLRRQFGENVEPVFERLRLFLHRMEKGRLIIMQ